MSPATRCGFAVLLGWTNVGKSTLLNRMVGEKVAAVADAAQTTRNTLRGVRNVEGEGQVVFVDTPGLHRPRHKMNRNMVRLATDSLAGVDLVMLVVDGKTGLGPGDERAAELARRSGRPTAAIVNKIDLVPVKERLLPILATLVEQWNMDEAFAVSALTGEGCAEMLSGVIARLPEGDPLFPADYYTDQPERALAAEWVRERLLEHTRQELPHAIAVTVERWADRDDGVVEIECAVIVERESQKGIVIGRGGTLLKRVGSEARAELERLLGTRVFLRLWVKVRSRWRDDDRTLRDLGLG